jgi:hypothetical protein
MSTTERTPRSYERKRSGRIDRENVADSRSFLNRARLGTQGFLPLPNMNPLGEIKS